MGLGIDNYVGVVVPVANEGMIVRGGSVGARPTASFRGIHGARLDCKFAFLCNCWLGYRTLCRRVSGGGSAFLRRYNSLGLSNT